VKRKENLQSLLADYSARDATEAGHLDRMRRLAGQSGDVFSRSHFVPGHFTASAFILSPDRKSLLLIHHMKLDRWMQPGGHIEADDADVLAAARREVEEEVGLPANLPLFQPGLFDLDIHPIPARGAEPQHEHFDVRYLFVANNSEARSGDGVKDWKWVPLPEVGQVTDDESVRRVALKLKQLVL
jgi:8-oxo-dGTP pyrophosphatase MutT (NUDIX family)